MKLRELCKLMEVTQDRGTRDSEFSVAINRYLKRELMDYSGHSNNYIFPVLTTQFS
jgi:hypothetical protein